MTTGGAAASAVRPIERRVAEAEEEVVIAKSDTASSGRRMARTALARSTPEGKTSAGT
jgi:hypothetical protein